MPAIDIVGFSLITIPVLTEVKSVSMSAVIWFKVLELFFKLIDGESSSGKSIEASMSARIFKILSINKWMSFENLPCSVINAALDAVIFEAFIMSATASACVKSILLFKNALSVNSPGFDTLASFLHAQSKI